MRVLFLTLWHPNAANFVSGTFVHDQAAALRDKGIDVRIMQPIPLTPFPVTLFKASYRALAALPDEEQYVGHPIYHRRYLALPGHRLFDRAGEWMYVGIRAKLLSLYREWPFDIIHAHTTYPCGFAANRCRDELFPKVKVLHTIHGTCIRDAPNYSRACRVKVRTSLEGADVSVFVSHELMRLGLEYTENRIIGRAKYVTNGVSPEKFSLNDDELREVGAVKNTYAETWNLVFVGNVSEAKGIKELLAAVRNLVIDDKRNLRLFLVGTNQLGEFIDQYATKHALRENIVLVGAIPHEQIKLWMRFADAFVLPSHSEGTPTVLFEALFVGVPSIFTKVGGVGDILTDGQEALLIPPGSVQATQNAIATLMRNPQLCQQLATRGHDLISRQFTWHANAQAMVGIYQRMLQALPEHLVRVEHHH